MQLTVRSVDQWALISFVVPLWTGASALFEGATTLPSYFNMLIQNIPKIYAIYGINT
jgi:hypothetical protein